MRTHYRFDSEWLVHAGADAVRTLVRDVPGYGVWWPGVRVLGDASTSARLAARMEVRAPLGYRIRFTITESVITADELRGRITGDLDGWVAWHLTAVGEGTRVGFSQQVEARSRLLRLASPLLHRQLAAQHERVMRTAERGMRQALETA